MSNQEGQLTVHDPRAAEQLRNAVRYASQTLSHLCLPTSNGSHILFRLRRLETAGQSCAVGLIHQDCSELALPEFADLGAAFGLTKSEHEAVVMLHRGLVADQIAIELSVSVDTVRSHIKGIYQKLGVCSREALFRKLQPYRLC